MSSRTLRQLASWIALVAIVLVTFMPAISGAMAAGGERTDVCSADFPGKPGPSGGSHPVLEHCPYCALHADLSMPPLPAATVDLVLAGFREFPPAFLQAARASLVWSTSQARAPPRFV